MHCGSIIAFYGFIQSHVAVGGAAWVLESYVFREGSGKEGTRKQC